MHNLVKVAWEHWWTFSLKTCSRLLGIAKASVQAESQTKLVERNMIHKSIAEGELFTAWTENIIYFTIYSKLKWTPGIQKRMSISLYFYICLTGY